MGHTRKAEAAPSPMELLAIFSAKETGVSVDEISKRTQYTKSSIIRWWKAWGHETAFVESVRCEEPGLLEAYSFDVLFPRSPEMIKEMIKEETRAAAKARAMAKSFEMYEQMMRDAGFADDEDA